MMIQAYHPLPKEIPYWLNLAGQNVIKAPKSLLFFLYPLGQTLFIIGFWLAGKAWVKKPEPTTAGSTSGKAEARTEKTWLEASPGAPNKQSGAENSSTDHPPSSEQVEDYLGTLLNSSQRGKKENEEKRPQAFSPKTLSALKNLRKELILLLLIFFNLIFIHIQRSLIWLAHDLSIGVNRFYFFCLFLIIFLLLPYYRFRRSLIIRLAKK
ncbi:MAG: hypothetical protein PHQ25_05250 [Acidobacteriota bacterium]|nr:hypothetical protein [Acidobacteriota bacterium]MDW3229156.1 hypothetical protein [Acidobacteriota bacterium]